MIDLRTCFTYAYSAGTDADFVQAITGDAASTNVLNLGAAGIKISSGVRPPVLVVKVVDAFVTLTSLEIVLETDSAVGFTTNKREVKMWRFLLAQLTAGALLINEALGHFKYQQFMRLYFNVVGSNPASGSSILAHLAEAPESAPDDIDLVTSGA